MRKSAYLCATKAKGFDNPTFSRLDSGGKSVSQIERERQREQEVIDVGLVEIKDFMGSKDRKADQQLSL